MKPILRNNTYHLRKRVPRRYASVEARTDVWISLATDSETVAKQKAPAAWDQMIQAWEARLDGDTTDAEARFEAAKNIAKRKGYKYMAISEVVKLPLSEVVARVDAAHDRAGNPNMQEAAALLGTAPKPEISLSKALEMFWPMAADRTIGKSEDQIRRWENPRKKAFANFISVNGDIQIDELTPDHMLDFCDWWLEKLNRENLTPNSANKDLTHFANVLRTVNKKKRLGLSLPLEGHAFKQGDKVQRPPFSKSWIRDKILAPNALDGLNPQARGILLGMINTGYRPSEGACLTKDQIHLDGPVPHISIEAVGRTLKSQYSHRVIPLVGISLKAFQEFPDGFPRYADAPALSDTINKFLKENGLKETPDHTLYSLRHGFEDRLLAVGVDERIRADLMGHSIKRERYGHGARMKKLHKLLKKIAL